MSGSDLKRIERALRGASADDEAAAAAGRFAERAEADGLIDVAYAPFDTPLGTGLVAATRRGLVRVALPNEPQERALERLAQRISPRVMEYRPRLDEARRELEEYFEGRRERFEVRLDWRLTHGEFARKVLHGMTRVPFGRTITYAEAAARAGRPAAHRAAGNALGANPIPIIVPCHRVLRTGGAIGGYGGGPELKEFLLRLEGALR
jgi:methylated-DNA-[protein]-cysteine S-methyltransferase